MSRTQAAKRAGISRSSGDNWARGRLPKDYVMRFPERAERLLADIETKKANEAESKALFVMAMQEGLPAVE